MGVDLTRVQSDALALLDQANRQRQRLGVHPEHFDVRTVEFLLLLRRLTWRDGVVRGRLLEVGSGSGYSLRLWAIVVDEAVGVDLPAPIEAARRLLAAFPPPGGNVRLVASTAEDLAGVDGSFDLILTQYVLEHVTDIAQTLSALRARVAEGGHVVHVLNGVVDRTDWYVTYRLQNSLLGRLRTAAGRRGFWAALRNPLEDTPPHEPRFGDFARELREYRLEKWALHILRAGFEIVDWFQARDVSWVLVTRPL